MFEECRDPVSVASPLDRCRICRSLLVPDEDACYVCGRPRLPAAGRLRGRSYLIRLGRRLIWVLFLLSLLGLSASVAAGPVAVVGWIPILLTALLLSLSGERANAVRFLLLGATNVVIFFLAVAAGVSMGCMDPESAPAMRRCWGVSIVSYAAFVALNSVAGYRIWARPVSELAYWECGRCGYFLYGLTEPRCPECGAPSKAPVPKQDVETIR